MTKIKKCKVKLVKLIVSIFLFYISMYGTLSVFLENSIIKSLKEVILIVLILTSLIWLFFRKIGYVNKFLFTLVVLFCLILIISLLSWFNETSLSILFYGFKITLLPMASIFLGIYLRSNSYSMKYVLSLIFGTLIIAWIIQWYIGVDKLILFGFEYAVNVKHIYGFPRLPSIVGTPDGYAFLLAIVGIILENQLLEEKKSKKAVLVKTFSIIFLLLSTIRSAILFYIICQLLVYTQNNKNKLTYFAFYMLTTVSILVFPVLVNSNIRLFSLSSLVDRVGHWAVLLPSIYSIEFLIGLGLGSVGAASRSVAELGLKSFDYAVDNQYVALFEQLGIVGIIIYTSFLGIILNMLIKVNNSKNNKGTICAIGLFIGTSISGFFTNILEVYPFNVFLFIFFGMQVYTVISNDGLPKIKTNY